MRVKLVSYSQPPYDLETNRETLDRTDDLIAYCARVSNPQNQTNKETNGRLLRYLIKNKHWSPFEMCSACLEITTTRDIARQLLRHRSFSFQEFSQRYSDVNALDDSFLLRDARLQDLTNRQNSIDNTDTALDVWWHQQQTWIIENVKRIYKEALERGIAKEQARAILPEGNTISKLYVNGTIRSWIHYIELRSANGTQREHMELARSIAKVIDEIFSP
tara:strand:+ start:511 stop:1167 length:657 start_codon:yes stop_codon:yes gene_type:complete